jgi:hypothetical protein
VRDFLKQIFLVLEEDSITLQEAENKAAKLALDGTFHMTDEADGHKKYGIQDKVHLSLYSAKQYGTVSSILLFYFLEAPR